MVVLQHGKYAREEGRIKTCYCACSFRYNRGDVITESYRNDYSGCVTVRYFVKCPECGCMLSVVSFDSDEPVT